MAFLGHSVDDSSPVELSDQRRPEGLYLIGAPGTGKSTLLANLILHDIKNNTGLIVLDPHGPLIDTVVNTGVELAGYRSKTGPLGRRLGFDWVAWDVSPDTP